MKNQAINTTPLIQSFYALGTINSLAIYGPNDKNAFNEAMECVYDIDNKMSAFRDDSEISAINNMAGINSISVSADTYFVIKKAVQYSALTEGILDITVAPILNLWREARVNCTVPNSEVLKTSLELVDYSNIQLGSSSLTVKLKHTGQLIDLGAIAKGYAADKVKRIFLKHNVNSAIIDLGGNVMTVGSREDGNPWRIGIQHPDEAQGNYIGTLNIVDKSVVTSGDYERFYISNGEKYHHIIDTKTGYPAKSGLKSVTVIAKNSIDADALTTALFIMGLDKGKELVESLTDIEAVFITDSGKVSVTDGLKKDFKLLDTGFEILA